jgi:Transketolase, N-terminal subunit
MDNIEYLKMKCNQTKKKCLEMCINAGTGHVTSAFSSAEIVTALYYHIMNYRVNDPNWQGRDRFVMSKNHGSVITYPILADLGFIEKEELNTFLQDDSRLGSHSKRNIAGVEFSGGSLGIGLGVACGMAYSAKACKEQWITYAIVGDGECYEGSIWESAMFAGHNQLNNLVVFLDRNCMCVTDYTENMLSLEPMGDKWRAFNWDVKRINGHDIEAIIESVKDVEARRRTKPLCVICDTVKGNGIDFMSNKLFMHGVAPKGDYAKSAMEQLGGNIS